MKQDKHSKQETSLALPGDWGEDLLKGWDIDLPAWDLPAMDWDLPPMDWNIEFKDWGEGIPGDWFKDLPEFTLQDQEKADKLFKTL